MKCEVLQLSKIKENTSFFNSFLSPYLTVINYEWFLVIGLYSCYNKYGFYRMGSMVGITHAVLYLNAKSATLWSMVLYDGREPIWLTGGEDLENLELYTRAFFSFQSSSIHSAVILLIFHKNKLEDRLFILICVNLFERLMKLFYTARKSLLIILNKEKLEWR